MGIKEKTYCIVRPTSRERFCQTNLQKLTENKIYLSIKITDTIVTVMDIFSGQPITRCFKDGRFISLCKFIKKNLLTVLI